MNITPHEIQEPRSEYDDLVPVNLLIDQWNAAIKLEIDQWNAAVDARKAAKKAIKESKGLRK